MRKKILTWFLACLCVGTTAFASGCDLEDVLDWLLSETESSQEETSLPEESGITEDSSIIDENSSTPEEGSSNKETSIPDEDSSSDEVSTPDEDSSSEETSIPEDSSSEETSVPEDSSSVEIEDREPSEGLEFTLSEDGTYYSVTGIGTCTDTDVVIPSIHKNLPVKEIGEWCFGDEGGGFNGSLRSIVIPDSVLSIGDAAFYGCPNLTDIIIGSGVSTIGAWTFDACISLTNIQVSENNGTYKSVDGNLYSKDGKAFVQYASGKTDERFIIPDGVISISQTAFGTCFNLKTVEIVDTVTRIDDCAFYDCPLTSIVIGKGVTSIGEEVFAYCGNLANITVDENNAIYKSIDGNLYSKDGKTFVQYASGKTDEKFIIPDGVTAIASSAFEGRSALMEVVIPNSVTSIGEYVFAEEFGGATIYCEVESEPSGWEYYWDGHSNPIVWDCNNNDVADDGYIYTVVDGVRYGIKDGTATVARQSINNTQKVTIPSSITYKEKAYNVTSIDNWAFDSYSNLTSIELGNSITSIGYGAFEYCFNLVEVINKSPYITVTKGSSEHGYVGYYAAAVYNSGDTFTETGISNDNGYIVYTNSAEKILMGYTGTDTDLVLPSYITRINYGAFEGCINLTSVEIPDSVTSIGDYAFSYCFKLTNIVIPDGVTSIGEGVFDSCVRLKSVVIPDSVTSIGDSAFDDCSNLTEVVIPNGVTSIGWGAFEECSSLTNVVIPDSVTNLDGWVFYECSSLTSVVIGDGVTSIEDSAFENCVSLTSLVIPDSVTSIDRYAFSGCSSLTSVVIGRGVTSIYEAAFENCSSLTSITFNGTVEEWNAIVTYADWNDNVPATEVVCSNGKVAI